jgi:hypothetical protein
VNKYEWQLLGNYGYGWDILTTETTRAGINARLKEYYDNDRHLSGLKLKRVSANA